MYDTSRNITINKQALTEDSVYKLTYYYTDLVTQCNLSVERYFRLSKNISKVLSQNGLLKKCSFDSLELKAFEKKPYYKYQWSTGDTSSAIKVIQPGKYYLTTYISFCHSKTDAGIHVTSNTRSEISLSKQYCKEVSLREVIR